jgi:L-2-hydroxyglutarate oxidase
MERIGVAIVGGGAVGCAVACELARAGMRDVFVLERMPHVGEEQSGRNSGVVHAGIYYASGSLKAQLCVAANPLIYELCRAHGVPIANVGKLVVAASPDELDTLG